MSKPEMHELDSAAYTEAATAMGRLLSSIPVVQAEVPPERIKALVVFHLNAVIEAALDAALHKP